MFDTADSTCYTGIYYFMSCSLQVRAHRAKVERPRSSEPDDDDD